jgi:LPS-assembly protein
MRIAVALLIVLGLSSLASAQQTVNGYTFSQDRLTQIAEHEYALVGHAEIRRGDVSLYADEIDFFEDQDRALATGNVLLSQGPNRIGADTAEFDTKAGTGIFYHAYGIANVQPPRRNTPVAPGAFAPPPQPANQDTDVYFFGDIVEKIGPKKYKITNGGFTTCLQPTPRWNLTAKTIVVNINHYTMLQQMVLNVKGVPLLYLPFMYYPTKEDDRATGFLIPTYSSSSVLGSSIHNAFFWAIDRSQDLTVQHEWFSKMGQGLGGEYRYNMGGGNSGSLEAFVLSPKSDAGTGIPTGNSFDIRGTADEMLPGNLRARANVNYFSDLQTHELFNNNLSVFSNNLREYYGNVVGAWRNYSLNANFDRREAFYSQSDSIVTGDTPRITVSRNERPLFPGSQIYFAGTGEFAHLSNETHQSEALFNNTVNRFDFSPTLRYPFKRWQFLTVNTSVAFHETFYTRSYETPYIAGGTVPNVVGRSLNRQYASVQAQVTGPVFSRIFDTPDSGYAEKFKHTIEPVFSIQRVTKIDDDVRLRIVSTDPSDYTVGGTTNVTYGINNRLLAKRRVGQSSQAVEILTLSVQQSYYTNSAASQYDVGYQATPSSVRPSNFSPIALNLHAAPTQQVYSDVRAQFDSRTRNLDLLSISGTYNWNTRVRTSTGWSRMYQEQPSRTLISNSINMTTTAQTADNRFGGTYSLMYDFHNDPHMQQQSVSGFYNAQCCGLMLGYMTRPFYFSSLSGASNHTFMFSVTLAGLGSVSPLTGVPGAGFGGFGGIR